MFEVLLVLMGVFFGIGIERDILKTDRSEGKEIAHG